jgi:pimeloyl-ACP methyl ester carboxylesterase
MRLRVLIAVLMFIWILSQNCGYAAQQGRKPQTLQLTSCELSGLRGASRCGRYEVFENRSTGKGRKISLRVVVLPASVPTPESDPFVYISGGPGSSAVDDAPYLAEAFAGIRERRDLLFVDQRGTGESNPLKCKFYNSADPQSYLGYFFPLEDVKQCRQQLESKADLTLYTTPIAMDDLDEVRAALGYHRLNLFGASYGTRAAMTYLKRHPEHVRTVTLQGVSPTNHYVPMDFPQQTERALQGVLAECAADEACHKAFPDLKADEKAVLDRLSKGPVDVELQRNGAATRVKLSRDLAAEAVRYMLYNAGAASDVPLFLHLAAQGNYDPLAEAALRFRKGIVATGSNGMYLSVTCAEDLPWIKPGEGERLASGTFLGDYRLRQQREACALWPRARIEAEYSEPVKSEIPVLIFTGEWDPVTPPANGDRVARFFKNSAHVVVPHGGHGFGGLEGVDCITRLITRFVEAGTVKGLDTSCVSNIRRKGFRTEK